MDIIQLISRVILFAVTLFLLMEFVFACNVTTWKGAVFVGVIIVIVFTLFFTLKRYRVKNCPTCGGGVISNN
ncbi:MAG: hypothetical protein CBD97_02075 [Pelagibacteraceae bacterium TMED237]|nr:MAG: hypothetical protein CBD97_02075 [Pelagibacteraceae bacterium TMED237]|tara:strand:- start:8597 stop:8812 length:216 start_codon:yes stop_codon:yes gene_type:complete